MQVGLKVSILLVPLSTKDNIHHRIKNELAEEHTDKRCSQK